MKRCVVAVDGRRGGDHVGNCDGTGQRHQLPLPGGGGEQRRHRRGVASLGDRRARLGPLRQHRRLHDAGRPVDHDRRRRKQVGDGNVTAPVDDGGSPITSYEVTSDPGGSRRREHGSADRADRLTNGTSYTFTVRASNASAPATHRRVASVTPRTAPGAPSIAGAVTPGKRQCDGGILGTR